MVRSLSSMLSQVAIEEAVSRIVSVAQSPLMVIVFGSYATGKAHDASDLDLLVVEDEIDSMPAEYGKIRKALGILGVGVDVLLYTRHEFEKRVNWPSSPVFDAVRQGLVLYDRSALKGAVESGTPAQPLTSLSGGLEKSSTFAADPLTIQRQLRDEWH